MGTTAAREAARERIMREAASGNGRAGAREAACGGTAPGMAAAKRATVGTTATTVAMKRGWGIADHSCSDGAVGR